MAICKFFLQSRCTKGTQCPFSHEASRTPAWRPREPTERAQCIFHQQGKCRNGAECTFEHSATVPSPATVAAVDHVGTKGVEQPAVGTSTDNRTFVTCRYYLHGSCTKGDACPYQHAAEPSKPVVEVADSADVQESEDSTRALQRALLGAFVQFDHGAVIQKISLASDYSAIRVDCSNCNNEVGPVLDIAHTLGFDIQPENVRLLPALHDTACSAQITVEDPTFDKRFCEKLRADTTIADVTATTMAPRLPSWAASRRINCRKVMLSCHRPTRLVWLNFERHSAAQRVCDKFNKGTYRITGHKVRAKAPTGDTTSRNHPGITVLLQNVPHDVSRLEVFDAIKADYDKPRHIELSKVSGYANIDNSFALIESLLSQVGPLEFTNVTKDDSKRFKAVALFSDENDARQAVETLHDSVQSFLNNDKLSLQLMSSSKFKVPSKICQATEQLFAEHIPSWNEEFVHFTKYPAVKGFVTLKIEGQSVKAVANATNIIDAIVAGTLVEVDGKPCWSSSLATNGPLFQQLKRMEKTFGVVIQRNKQKQQLRYFGSQPLYAAVLTTLLAEIDADASTAHHIQLDTDQFAWACRGGFNQLSSALQEGICSFDITSVPKQIVVTGSEEQYQRALAIVTARSADIAKSSAVSSNDEDCAICWTVAEDPVTLQCGHAYCLDCFERLCLSGDASGTDFSITCQGDAALCQHVVTSQELRDHLTSTTLEDVLEASFAAYIRRRPQELRCCPSPDCGYVFRAGTLGKIHTCIKCLEPICMTCFEQHGTMSCADYKDLASGGHAAFEKFKQEMNIKDCPKCKTPIEKTMGCNHMTCGGCSAHICWVCLQTFATGPLCYGHLVQVHGRIADVEDLLL